MKLEFIGGPVFCPGTYTELSVKNNYKAIAWNDTSKDVPYLVVKKPGKYWATIVNKKGCRYTDTLQVALDPRPSFTLGRDTTILVVDTVVLKAPETCREYRWMDWSTAPAYIARAIDFKPSTQSYWVNFTDLKGCTWADTIAICYVDVPDLSDYMHVKLTTYPNPVSDNLTWKLETDKTCRLTIDVADSYGHLVYTEKVGYYAKGMEKQISMSQLPVGAYLVRVKNSTTGKVYGSSTIIKQ
jgi:hypothetical protein